MSASSLSRPTTPDSRPRVEAQLDEVKASRTRIIAAGDAERKRVERDLHDGAQQRLVSLTLALRLARASLGDDLDPSAKLSLDQASAEAKAALSELRELARGIHPQILTEAGLGPAVDSLAARSPVDVRVEIGSMRFSPIDRGRGLFHDLGGAHQHREVRRCERSHSFVLAGVTMS